MPGFDNRQLRWAKIGSRKYNQYGSICAAENQKRHAQKFLLNIFLHKFFQFQQEVQSTLVIRPPKGPDKRWHYIRIKSLVGARQWVALSTVKRFSSAFLSEAQRHLFLHLFPENCNLPHCVGIKYLASSQHLEQKKRQQPRPN